MSDVLVQFDEPQRSADGRMFTAQVMGARLPTGLWEAWIEFHPRVGGEPLRTPRETEQLSRGDLRFWAAGITREHLGAALSRALAPSDSQPLPTNVQTAPELEDGETVVETPFLRDDEPVLDPMGVYRHSGEYCLRQELRALDAQQLATIISAHAIEDMDVVDLARTYEDALAERIVASVQHNVVREQTLSDRSESRAPK
jgi:hypothetical protein